MLPVLNSSTTVAVAADFSSSSSSSLSFEFLLKDGRKIRVGDCALFKPPQDSPPFIGIIRKLITGKEESLHLGVNWLYRPSDVKLGKDTLLEAAPNEIFYSFHKDEIPAASLLHPCKVAFLRKGVELPSGISSYVCRRVYDIENSCLWWLTDKDYINERQEEVDKLLDKTRTEMNGAVQSGGRSPKPLNGPTSTAQLKPNSDSAQNSTSFSSHAKVKKRERSDQVSEPAKRERFCKAEDGNFGQSRAEHALKSEIAKITDKGGLVDFEGVEKLVQLMLPDGIEKKIDVAGRIMLVDVIAVTDRFDCLERFVQLRGLPVLDEWLQEVHKGKVGDGASPKESDKSVEEFLLALLRALDKLPVNLHALQSCYVGKSVNHLRSHKNSEIQKKARSLVDTWKKRVEAEMNMNDAKTGSGRGVSWPTKPAPSEISHVGNRRSGASAEVAMRSSTIQASSSKSSLVKLAAGENVAKSSLPGTVKSTSTAMGVNSKDPNSRMLTGTGISDPLLTPIKEERSSSSSQSQNNSQSCSSDHARTVGSSCREDARSSTTGSVTVSRSSSGASRHRKSSNGVHGSVASGVQKDNIAGKVSSANKSSTSEKLSPTGVSHDKASDIPIVDHGNNQRLIVRLPNTGRSPSRGASGGPLEDPTAISGRASPSTEKHDSHDRNARGKGEVSRSNNVSSMHSSLCQGKDAQCGLDEGNNVIALNERQKIDHESPKIPEASKATGPLLGVIPRLGKSYDASLSSINALVESCAKISEASASASPEDDDVGMNLLASVAAGEILKADTVSPSASPLRSSPVAEESSTVDDGKLKNMVQEATQIHCKSNDVPDDKAAVERPNSVDSLLAKKDMGHPGDQMLTHVSGESKVSLVGSEDKKGESSANLHQSAEVSCLRLDVKSSEQTCDSLVINQSLVENIDNRTGVEGVNESLECMKSGNQRDTCNFISDFKSRGRSSAFDGDSKVNFANETAEESSVAPASELSATGAKCSKELDEKPTCSSLEAGLQKHSVDKESSSVVLIEQKPSENVLTRVDSLDRMAEVASLPSPSGNLCLVEPKAVVPDNSKIGCRVELNEKPQTDLVSSGPDHNNECVEDNLDRKDVLGASMSHVELPTVSMRENDPSEKSSGSNEIESGEIKKRHSSVANASVSATGSGMAVKLDFDLNEGFPIDDGNQGEPTKSVGHGISSTVHLPCPLPIPVSSISGSFSTSITVAAAAKGPFVLPENPLRNKGELGWKGSAATSAFRPAEPRKNLEMSTYTGETSMVDTSSKQGRAPLDFDLNVPDERVLEDVASQNSPRASCSEPGARDRTSGGGLDLDLNRVDESPDTGLLSHNSSRFEISTIPSKSSLPGGFSNSALNISRDFDLNNGPGLDELGPETASRSQSMKSSLPFSSSVPALRMNGAELGNFSSWYPPTNAYSALTVPSVFPGRGEQSFVAPAGSQRILTPPNTSTTFVPEIYRGSVLSSSPALPFPAAAPFQYPGFPFETSFPLPSHTFSGASTAYMESSSGSALCFPTVPSQLVGSAGVVSSPYPRPFMMSLPGGSSSLSSDNRKWGGQLDLNAGPGGSDTDQRDERLPSAIRQHSLPGLQVMTEEQMKMYQVAGVAGSSVFKRKEPDGSWETPDRFHSYKQSSWK
ncbi:hypothetical protein K2173_014320 [Erythroxylum novogranatense]|uniref:Uncharacterized protein n=1 Tax=Erythroxylum novogranatense TaxID=1862640 RepID=A0AAV8SEQ0_9ROSI|nr:hypothetical protein K2173_014320 [Erythroxylum novogranatense]